MRYLIGEASWAGVDVATRLAASGILLTRTDCPEHFHLYHEMEAHDLAIIDSKLLDQGPSLRHLRSSAPNVPICVVVHGNDPDERAALLRAGADLVLPNDLSYEELHARLCALARRAHGLSTPYVQAGPLLLNLWARTAHLNGTRLALAPKLYETMEFLALRQQQVVTRDQLLSHVYVPGEEPGPRIFDVYMNALRSHFAPFGDQIAIVTHRGVGFRMVVASAQAVEAAVA